MEKFGKLTINEFGQRRLRELVEAGMSEASAALELHGLSAVQFALSECKLHRTTVEHMIAHFGNDYFPPGTKFTIKANGVTLRAADGRANYHVYLDPKTWQTYFADDVWQELIAQANEEVEGARNSSIPG